jgi:hypothetical protein
MRSKLTSRTIVAGVFAATALPVLTASPTFAQKMSGGKMSSGKMTSHKMSGGKMTGGMSASDKMMMDQMMAKMSASDKKTYMGMTMAEKKLCMKMCHMSGGMMKSGSMMHKKM